MGYGDEGLVGGKVVLGVEIDGACVPRDWWFDLGAKEFAAAVGEVSRCDGGHGWVVARRGNWGGGGYLGDGRGLRR